MKTDQLPPRPPAIRAPDPAVLHAAAAVHVAGAGVRALGLWLSLAARSALMLRVATAYGVFGLVGFLSQMVVAMKGRLLPIYFVNIGPGTAAAHVIGGVIDRASAGADWVHGVQTFGVPAGAGAMIEFFVPAAGIFPFVDHDKLAFLPFGLALPFATAGVDGRAH